MRTQFIIPSELGKEHTTIYAIENLNEDLVRVNFPLGDQITFTDYEKSYVDEKFKSKEWVQLQ